MKLDAVLHIPMSEYCCGLDEEHILYRLRCAAGDMKRVTLFYADTACRVTPILFTPVSMERILSDAYHDYWQVTEKRHCSIMGMCLPIIWWMTAPSILSFPLITGRILLPCRIG